VNIPSKEDLGDVPPVNLIFFIKNGSFNNISNP
jgi:hypothetical protein